MMSWFLEIWISMSAIRLEISFARSFDSLVWAFNSCTRTFCSSRSHSICTSFNSLKRLSVQSAAVGGLADLFLRFSVSIYFRWNKMSWFEPMIYLTKKLNLSRSNRRSAVQWDTSEHYLIMSWTNFTTAYQGSYALFKNGPTPTSICLFSLSYGSLNL